MHREMLIHQGATLSAPGLVKMLSYIYSSNTIDARPLGSKEDTIRASTFVTGESKITLSSC